ncbi:bleomycin resistance protein [Roseococcus sp. SYP-B2431]|uniref:VOC family protein n=1 Tax=Roseococcus sp. SYP-B2431 TaxID=2496640 RepID=UPI0010393070|nr:VOC family protein [Roseococcus sp. SYP-B2431]TCH97427.1 bleomycin resistance protein [Roseococcus sp. SYP-B2431]
MRGVVHHIDLTVRDPKASFALYHAVLTALGYRLLRQGEEACGWELVSPLGEHSIDIRRAREESAGRPHDRYAPGLHHLAFAVESRAAVDEMHALLLKTGAPILDAPAEYPEYNQGRGYYAVFFADPDGLKLECVFTPPPRAAA